jgi:predicted HAD superfamily Cof-like phosphohydrolase
MASQKIVINDTQTLYIDTVENTDGVFYTLKIYENNELENGFGFQVNNMIFPKFANQVTMAMKIADSYQVLQFTEQSKNIKCPKTPTAMSIDELRFVYQMILSELVEGAQTVCETTDDALEFVHKCIGVDTNRTYKKPVENVEIIAQQADAFVDAWYYMLNAACKKGWNLAPVFGEVHLANMNKRWTDGKFHIRADGKIEKPPNHEPADINKIINEQLKSGSF